MNFVKEKYRKRWTGPAMDVLGEDQALQAVLGELIWNYLHFGRRCWRIGKYLAVRAAAATAALKVCFCLRTCHRYFQHASLLVPTCLTYLLYVINVRNDAYKIKYDRKRILGTHAGNSGSFFTARLVCYLQNDLGNMKCDLCHQFFNWIINFHTAYLYFVEKPPLS